MSFRQSVLAALFFYLLSMVWLDDLPKFCRFRPIRGDLLAYVGAAILGYLICGICGQEMEKQSAAASLQMAATQRSSQKPPQFLGNQDIFLLFAYGLIRVTRPLSET